MGNKPLYLYLDCLVCHMPFECNKNICEKGEKLNENDNKERTDIF